MTTMIPGSGSTPTSSNEGPSLMTAGQALPSEDYTVQAMPHVMGSLNMTAVYIIAIFFIVNAVTVASGGAAAFTYLALGAVAFFIPCAIVTAQLGVLHPHEGSLYNWTHRALGGYWSFFIGFCAWFPGVLILVAGADIVVSYVQGLNGNWLVQPWQQGAVLIGIIVFTTVIALLQPTRVLTLMANFTMGAIGLAVLLVGLAGVVWLLKGHASATNFHQVSGWGIHSGNIGLFGLITLAYLGTSVPLNMAGEMKRPGTTRIVKSHLLWGTVLVLVGYFIATWAVLVTQGSAAANIGGFAIVTTVHQVFGPFLSGVVAVCIMLFFVMVTLFYSVTFSRILLAGGIDQRLPVRVARLNKNRVPSGAILVQAVFAICFAILAFGIPYFSPFGAHPADLSIDVYNVFQASAMLVWAISSAFLFINVIVLYRRDRVAFRSQRVLPMPILWLCCIIGPLACGLAIYDTVKNSWIPHQISNDQWWWIVSGITMILIVIAAFGSTVANSEANWEITQQE